jgi:hypothetical protein
VSQRDGKEAQSTDVVVACFLVSSLNPRESPNASITLTHELGPSCFSATPPCLTRHTLKIKVSGHGFSRPTRFERQ